MWQQFHIRRFLKRSGRWHKMCECLETLAATVGKSGSVHKGWATGKREEQHSIFLTKWRHKWCPIDAQTNPTLRWSAWRLATQTNMATTKVHVAMPSSIALLREMRKITLDDEMSEWKIAGSLESQACSAPWGLSYCLRVCSHFLKAYVTFVYSTDILPKNY